MPIYEYICKKCGADIEVIQKFSDPPLKKHDDCGGKLTKKLSLSAFHLKGGGWYADGYGQKKAEKQKTEKKDSKKTVTKTEKKTEAKTPAKSS
jgi:putative FmdB family regulatory protein